MHESLVNNTRNYWDGERRFLPVSAAIAVGVCLAAWYWRFDRLADSSQSFYLGILVGALMMGVLYGGVTVINLGVILKGFTTRASLVQKAVWLVRPR